VLLVEAPPPALSPAQNASAATLGIAARIAQIQAETGAGEKEALKRVAHERGQSKSDVYRELQRERARR